ncbi:MAG: adenine deaminase [Granulosicoccus sp.]
MSTIENEPADLNDISLRDHAVAAARGDEPFDLLIQGGAIFDAITGETRIADIGIVDRMIASVHRAGQHTKAHKTLDATGMTTIPGLIDTHMHIESSMITPARYADAVLPRGVTTIVWDPHELGNVHGLDGVQWAIDACRPLDLRVILLAPSCVPSAPGMERGGADFTASTLEKILAYKEIGGVAEVMNMHGVINRDARMSGIVQAGLTSGKPVFGHARGLQESSLAAFMAAGVISDHEITSADDLMHKLRAGIGIELRGSHDHLLPECVEALNTLDMLPPSVTLCTDDVFPDDLYHRGALDDVVRRLIRYGMPASWALRAATYHASLRLSRPDLGLIAAGRRADLALVDSLQSLDSRHVIANGKNVASEGRCHNPATITRTDALQSSVKLEKVHADDFRYRVNTDLDKVTVRAIARPRFTEHVQVTASVVDGFLVPPDDVILMAVVHRHGKVVAAPALSYLKHWGRWHGAFASTVSHDSHNLTVFGGNETDVALACNAVIDMQGGMAVAKSGQLLQCLPLPLSGLISDTSLQDTASQFEAIRKAMDQVVQWQPPYLVFKACFGASLACNAGPHLTDMGIVDAQFGPGPIELCSTTPVMLSPQD